VCPINQKLCTLPVLHCDSWVAFQQIRLTSSMMAPAEDGWADLRTCNPLVSSECCSASGESAATCKSKAVKVVGIDECEAGGQAAPECARSISHTLLGSTRHRCSAAGHSMTTHALVVWRDHHGRHQHHMGDAQLLGYLCHVGNTLQIKPTSGESQRQLVTSCRPCCPLRMGTSTSGRWQRR
jgi:hypothetical protein